MHSFFKKQAVTLAFLSTCALANAGTASVAAVGKGAAAKPEAAAASESPFDKIWGLAKLYSNDANPVIQELAFFGRYHGQYYDAEGDDSSESDWEHRRFRLGLQGTFASKKLVLRGEMYSDLNSGGEFYEGFTDLQAGIRPNGDESLVIIVGKQKPKFSQDWSTSSRLINTFERSRMVNQFKPDYTAGVSLLKKDGNWSYYGGVFANDPNETFADFDGGLSYIASIGYDMKESFGSDKAVVRLDYIHSNQEESDTIYTAFENGVEVSLDYKQGPLGLVVATQYGSGDANAWGAHIQPTYDLSKQVQLVARYQIGTSSSDDGLSPNKRYEGAAGMGKGDFYQSIYGGVNYFIYEHKAKLMAGVEYADMDGGGDALTFLGGVRIYW